MKMERIGSSETLALEAQTPREYKKKKKHNTTFNTRRKFEIKIKTLEPFIKYVDFNLCKKKLHDNKRRAACLLEITTTQGTEQVTIAVTLQAYIPEVPGSNIGRDIHPG